MRSRSVMTVVLLAGAVGRPSDAQEPPAYKGVFWYETLRPSRTLRHRTYDVSKGEYDARAVDRWLDAVGRIPTLGAYVRDIRTDGEPGATEPERLASAIRREERRWADLNNRPAFLPIPDLIDTPTTRRGPPRSRGLRGGITGRAGFDRPSPRSSWSLGAPSSPFPYPYRAGPR